MLRGDKYNRWIWGLEADRPDAATVNPETVYVATDTASVAVEHNGEWVIVTTPGPHALDPAAGPHTGKLPWSALDEVPSYLASTLQRGYAASGYSPDAPIPASVTVLKGWFSKLSLSGTVVVLQEVHLHVSQAPAADTVYTIKRNSTTVGTVTISSGAWHGELVLDPEVELDDDDSWEVISPGDTQGALGLTANLVLARKVA